jgi:SAM-dependent methyltransferase
MSGLGEADGARSDSPMRLLFLISGRQVPSSRFRVLQFVPYLEGRGHVCAVAASRPPKLSATLAGCYDGYRKGGIEAPMYSSSKAAGALRTTEGAEMADKGGARQSLGQEKIWEHFQNAAIESFAGASPRLNFLVRQIARKVKHRGLRLLNIGAGSGHLERAAYRLGWKVHSLDLDPRTIERLVADGIHGHVGRIEAIPLDNDTFDFIVASEVLEHLTDAQRRQGICEIARVLKPFGWFLGTVPYREELAANQVICPSCGELFHRWGHHQSFTLESISAELAARFQVVELRRTAFVSFGDRNLLGKFKSLVRLLLARYGEMIAVPTIYWAARKQ